MKERKLNYISLFSSAGIGCFGFEKENFECIATAEYFDERLEFQRMNKNKKHNTSFIQGDIRKNYSRILSLAKEREEIDVVIATPPCQGMSTINHHKKDDDTDRNSLIFDSIILVEKIQPRIFIFENVRTFLKTLSVNAAGNLQVISEVIDEHLSTYYTIEKKIVNLKNYGSNSSRTRTIVVGTRKDQSYKPWDIFYEFNEPKTLREVIGDLPNLKEMGESYENDILHNYKAFDKRMLPWIEKLKEGQSAFDNSEKSRVPHQIIDGKYKANVNKVGDKYKRQRWDNVAPCITTRNDQLASQNTIHPEDNRVFSIREIMRMMSIPDDFKFLKYNSKEELIKKQSLIRTVLGEAVPTRVFQMMAKNIKNVSNDFDQYEPASEELKKDFAAFYTRKSTVNKILEYVDFNKKESVKILEPSVGSGVFIEQIIKKFPEQRIHFTLVEKDKGTFLKMKKKFSKYKNSNHKFTFINKDFFNIQNEVYDLVIGNPPFGIKDESNYEMSKDIYMSFLLKSFEMNFSEITFIIPKMFLDNPKSKEIRKYITNNFFVKRIIDFGSSAFKDARIETISLTITPTKQENTHIIGRDGDEIKIEYKELNDIRFDSWLIYKDAQFESVLEKIDIDYFDFYRERGISKKDLITEEKQGLIPVVKSFNIKENMTNVEGIKFWTKANKLKIFENAYFSPNMTYKTRIAFAAGKFVSDGSCAVMIPKNKVKLTKRQIEYFSSDEFREFYSVARNKMERTINIDSNSIKYWGVLKNEFKVK